MPIETTPSPPACRKAIPASSCCRQTMRARRLSPFCGSISSNSPGRQKHRALKDELCPVPGHVPHEAIDHAVLFVEGAPPAEMGPPPPILPPLPHTPAPYWQRGWLVEG